jgi:hypothetical protein
MPGSRTNRLTRVVPRWLMVSAITVFARKRVVRVYEPS